MVDIFPSFFLFQLISLFFCFFLYWQAISSKTCLQRTILVPVSLVGLALIQKSVSLVNKAIPDLELKLKRTLDLETWDRTAIHYNLKTISKCFTNRLEDMENKTYILAMANPTKCPKWKYRRMLTMILRMITIMLVVGQLATQWVSTTLPSALAR